MKLEAKLILWSLEMKSNDETKCAEGDRNRLQSIVTLLIGPFQKTLVLLVRSSGHQCHWFNGPSYVILFLKLRLLNLSKVNYFFLRGPFILWALNQHFFEVWVVKKFLCGFIPRLNLSERVNANDILPFIITCLC